MAIQNQPGHSERQSALRALLMAPLMTPAHAEFASVRRHAEELRTWFAREAGWRLQVERDCARLYKQPGAIGDATRGLPGYDRRRYVLLCLACAVLERADAQITLRLMGERMLQLTADPALAALGFRFELTAIHERRELASVCRSLLQWGVLERVAGDEDEFVRGGNAFGEGGDALYDIQRRVLAGVLAATRGPSTWPAEDAPRTLPERLTALVAEPAIDSDDGRRTAWRHGLARRLLDDPVVYFDDLGEAERTYLSNQRGAMGTRLGEASGLAAEQRAEGLALVDADGELTDVAMPAEGTEAHVTLLAAGWLAHRPAGVDAIEVADHLAQARAHFGRYWRKSAREAGSEHELARIALERLAMLRLVTVEGDRVVPLPALARYALGDVEIRKPAPTPLLFDTP